MPNRNYHTFGVNSDSLSHANIHIAEAIEWFGRTRGNSSFDEGGFDRLLPHLQIHAVTEGGTPYLHCGAETTTARLYGRDFATQALGKDGVPDSQFEAHMRQLYLEVIQKSQPAGQSVIATIEVGGTLIPVSYYRFVFPLSFRCGECVAVLTAFTNERLQPVPGEIRQPANLIGAEEGVSEEAMQAFNPETISDAGQRGLILPLDVSVPLIRNLMAERSLELMVKHFIRLKFAQSSLEALTQPQLRMVLAFIRSFEPDFKDSRNDA